MVAARVARVGMAAARVVRAGATVARAVRVAKTAKRAVQVARAVRRAGKVVQKLELDTPKKPSKKPSPRKNEELKAVRSGGDVSHQVELMPRLNVNRLRKPKVYTPTVRQAMESVRRRNIRQKRRVGQYWGT